MLAQHQSDAPAISNFTLDSPQIKGNKTQHQESEALGIQSIVSNEKMLSENMLRSQVRNETDISSQEYTTNSAHVGSVGVFLDNKSVGTILSDENQKGSIQH